MSYAKRPVRWAPHRAWAPVQDVSVNLGWDDRLKDTYLLKPVSLELLFSY